MTREEKILTEIDPNTKGLEIGPGYSPVVPKRAGFNVRTLDVLDREGLIRKYEPLGVDITGIEDVDYVWDGGMFADLIGEGEKFDWIVASHVIEHTPDLISFLNQCESILTTDGILSFAVPDKRYCFDRFREKTSLSTIIDVHDESRAAPSRGVAAEHCLNAVARNGETSWCYGVKGEYRFINPSFDDAKKSLNTPPLDLHCWCFTPYSFRLLIEDLYKLGFTRLREHYFFETVGNEFHMSLTFLGLGPSMSRMELLKLSDAD